MTWLPMYLNKEDLYQLLTWLNDEADIAFIVYLGAKQWQAFETIAEMTDGRFCIWHQKSGPLPLIGQGLPDTSIDDPWAGWKGEGTGTDTTEPYFGPGHPGIYWLNAQTSSRWNTDAIGLSSFEWIGNHYKATGEAAPPAAKQWWERLRRWVMKQAVRIPRSGSWDDSAHAEIWAFPGALANIKAGKQRDDNP